MAPMALDLAARLAETPLIAMITEPDAPAVPEVVVELAAAGIPAAEITLTTASALETLRRSAGVAPILLGAGTVLTPELARKAVDAGADYLLTPGVVPDVLAEAERLGVPVVSGAFTLTEILDAHRRGAALVKLFPAWLGGPRYVAGIHFALPQIPLVPTGGVDRDNAAAFVEVGATAVALGGALIGDALRGGDIGQVRKNSEDLIRLIGKNRD